MSLPFIKFSVLSRSDLLKDINLEVAEDALLSEIELFNLEGLDLKEEEETIEVGLMIPRLGKSPRLRELSRINKSKSLISLDLILAIREASPEIVLASKIGMRRP